jgi:hypothetical protein
MRKIRRRNKACRQLVGELGGLDKDERKSGRDGIIMI